MAAAEGVRGNHRACISCAVLCSGVGGQQHGGPAPSPRPYTGYLGGGGGRPGGRRPRIRGVAAGGVAEPCCARRAYPAAGPPTLRTSEASTSQLAVAEGSGLVLMPRPEASPPERTREPHPQGRGAALSCRAWRHGPPTWELWLVVGGEERVQCRRHCGRVAAGGRQRTRAVFSTSEMPAAAGGGCFDYAAAFCSWRFSPLL